MALRNVDIIKGILFIIIDSKLDTLEYDDNLNPGLSVITIGTCKNLLDGLIFPLDQDMSYGEVFLATYRFFIPAQTLLESLVGWYNCKADDARKPGSEAFLKRCRKGIQARSIRVLVTWIRNHWTDFHEDPKLTDSLNIFINFVSKLSFGTYQKLIQATREQVYSD